MPKFKIVVTSDYEEISEKFLLKNLKEFKEKNPLFEKYLAFIAANKSTHTPLLCNEWMVEFDIKNEGELNENIKTELESIMQVLIDAYGDAINLFSNEDIKGMVQSALKKSKIRDIRDYGAVRALNTRFPNGVISPVNLLIDKYETYTEKELQQ